MPQEPSGSGGGYRRISSKSIVPRPMYRIGLARPACGDGEKKKLKNLPPNSHILSLLIPKSDIMFFMKRICEEAQMMQRTSLKTFPAISLLLLGTVSAG